MKICNPFLRTAVFAAGALLLQPMMPAAAQTSQRPATNAALQSPPPVG